MRISIIAPTLLAGMLFVANTATAQTAPAKPDVNFITQSTSKFTIPEGSTEDDMWKLHQEYFDKVISKSTILKHYSIYRHAWGSTGATIVVTLEFAKWEDIMKFNDEETEALEKAAWPDESARKAFQKKMSSFENPYHHDEIYTISNTMRK